MKRMLLLFLLPALLLSGCSQKPISAQSFAMDTVLTVTLYQGGSDALVQEALSLADEMERRLSRHIDGTEISTLNHTGSASLSNETADLLRLCQKLHIASGGAFDIGLGGVSDLWNFTGDVPSIPSAESIQEALSQGGMDKLSLEGNEAVLLGSGAQLDLGAVAKGALADEMATLLQEGGADSFLLNLGGNIYVSGGSAKDPFRIGIEDPRDPEGVLGVLRLTNGAISTSSGSQRGFTLDGVRYHHILDPKTGCPADAELLLATVVCERGALADALSTACFVLGEEGSAALLEQYPDASALLLREDGSLRIIGDLDFEAA